MGDDRPSLGGGPRRELRGVVAEDAEVRLGLGAVVESKDGFDETDEIVGELNSAFADAIGVAVRRLLRESGSEGGLHGGSGSGDPDAAGSGGWGSGLDGETKLFCEEADRLDGDRVRPMLLGKLGAGEAHGSERLRVDGGLRTDEYGDGYAA